MFRKGVVVTPEDFEGVDWIGKCAELGLNTLGIHSGGGAGHNVLEKLGRFSEESFRAEALASGIDIEYECHAPHELLPRSLFAEHPEYFPYSWHGGMRVESGNWCSGSALPLVGRNGGALGRRLSPTNHRHFYWGEDRRGAWCHCETCSKLSSTDQSLLAVNAIARDLAATDPKAQVGFIAYSDALEAAETVKPAPNVILEFAPMHRCYRHAINDPDCSINRACWRQLHDHLKVFDAERAHVLEYWLDSSWASGWKKPAKRPAWFDRKLVERDINAYASLGIRSVTTFAVFMDGTYFEAFGDRELREYAEILSALD